MRHRLTVEQQIEGAKKALARMSQSSDPRVQNLCSGLRKLISKLENKKVS